MDDGLEDVNEVVEWVGGYKKGGFHPVHFGDAFKNGRYTVCRKLGFGRFATVWLARDVQLQKYVALKIGMDPTADGHDAGMMIEANVLSSLPTTTSDPGRQHVPLLLDSFTHRGPNGRHPCLVFQPLGRPFETIIRHTMSLWGDSEGEYDSYYWQPSFTREVARQLVQAIHFLHTNGVMHRDIKADNIMLTIDDAAFDLRSIAEVNADCAEPGEEYGPTIEAKRRDGKPLDPSAGLPIYLAKPTPLHDKMPLCPPPSTFSVMLTDYGAACKLASANDGLDAYAWALRPPELIFNVPAGQPLSPAADIWDLALIIYQLVTLNNLWPSSSFSDTDEFRDADLLCRMIHRLGPMPKRYWEAWGQREGSTRDEWVLEDGTTKPDVDSEGEPVSEEEEEEDPERERWDGPLSAAVRLGKPEKMGAKETEAFLKFLEHALAWLPEDRATAAELLSSEWLTGDWKDGLD